ncbi:hypothetical protein ACTFIZ_008228 [Dictyostelium cf. discoideum]
MYPYNNQGYPPGYIPPQVGMPGYVPPPPQMGMPGYIPPPVGVVPMGVPGCPPPMVVPMQPLPGQYPMGAPYPYSGGYGYGYRGHKFKKFKGYKGFKKGYYRY